MKLLRFFLIHSLRDMWRNRSRTVFALICVATGVASVVALRTLAFMVADELTTNLAQMNRGDIRIYASRGVPDLVELSQQGQPVFNSEGVRIIREWAAREGVEVSAARMAEFVPLRRVQNGKVEKPQPVFALYVEPEYYPFYDPITLEAPAGKQLEDALGTDTPPIASLLPKLGMLGAAPFATFQFESAWLPYSLYLTHHLHPLVISSRLGRTASLGLQVGDIIRLGSADDLYVVSGVAPSSAETILSTPQTAFFDYVYVPLEDLRLQGEEPLPDQIYVKVPLGRDIEAVEKSLIAYLQDSFDSDTDFNKELNRATVPELEKQNADTANVIDKMILVMGLSSLLIGGIGIINTMLVVVNRRTLEIAVLKTLGLKGYRVTALFLIESLLMGLIGSLIGIVVGVILSYVIRDVGEEAFSLSLEWRLYPEAMASGLFLGMIITALFGFLPTLIAGQVRPAIVLRPNEAQMPAAGLVQTLVTIVIMIVILGLLVSTIVEHAIHYGPVYMLAGAGALVGLFAGIIIANTRVGQPIPDYYEFHLSRRFERLENWLTGAVGLLPISRERNRQARGRASLTATLRALRQSILAYGALAIGAALASGIFLILSEVWLPFGIGDSKPANDVVGAWKHHDTTWVIAWLLVALLIGFLIRWHARAMVSVIALGSLGITLGGLLGLAGGTVLERLLADTGVWEFLTSISTGMVLVEGTFALLGAIYIGYWLLVWAAGKMPVGLLMVVIAGISIILVAGSIAAVALLGTLALILLAVVVFAVWLLAVRRFRWQQPARNPQPVVVAGPTPSVIMFSVVMIAAGFLLKDYAKPVAWAAGALGFLALWIAFRRRYSVDGRLILREIAGRRSRIASTLLGLSVGIAGLSLVSLTTGAASHLLEVQLDQNAEGNLLIVDIGAHHKEDVRAVLDDQPGVEHFSQFTTYQSILMEVDGKPVTAARSERISEENDPHENSNFERVDQGVSMLLSVRDSLEQLPAYDMKEGHPLLPEDAGKHRIILRDSFFIEETGIKNGSHLLFSFPNGPGKEDDILLRLTVVGIIARQSEQAGLGDQFLVPPGTLPDAVDPMGIFTIAMVNESDPAYMDNVLISVADLQGVVAVELGVLTQLLENLLDQLKAIPTLVAWLALVAGTAIIANTVALATQERRRQIGVMKVLGLKGYRVLVMLIFENGLIGLIAGIIGVCVGLLVTVILVLSSPSPGELKRTLEFSTMGWLIFMSIAVAIGAATVSAWSAAAEKPMDVLRYE